MYERIPDELKQNGRFCLWRYELRNGKKTKVPYRTDGSRASPGNPSDFVPFETVVKAFSDGSYDGIGLYIGGKFSAIDIDGCLVDGNMTDILQYYKERSKK